MWRLRPIALLLACELRPQPLQPFPLARSEAREAALVAVSVLTAPLKAPPAFPVIPPRPPPSPPPALPPPPGIWALAGRAQRAASATPAKIPVRVMSYLLKRGRTPFGGDERSSIEVVHSRVRRNRGNWIVSAVAAGNPVACDVLDLLPARQFLLWDNLEQALKSSGRRKIQVQTRNLVDSIIDKLECRGPKELVVRGIGQDAGPEESKATETKRHAQATIRCPD